MSTITTKDGTTLYYKDWGEGPAITFSHGWPLNADAWDGQMLFLIPQLGAAGAQSGLAGDAAGEAALARCILGACRKIRNHPRRSRRSARTVWTSP